MHVLDFPFGNFDLNREDSAVHSVNSYRKVPEFSDTRKLCYNLPKIQTKRQNLLIFRLKDANGIANNEDPDQTAPLGAV